MSDDHLIASAAIVCAVVAAVIASLASVGVAVLCLHSASTPSGSSGSSGLPAQSASDAVSHENLVGVLERRAGMERGRVEDEERRRAAEKARADEASARAEALASSGIVVDGLPLDRDRAEVIARSAQPFVGNVEYIDQRDILPAGCEIVALSVALRAEGFDVSPVEVAERYLDLSGESDRSYGGSPWADGGGLPPSIVDAGNACLSDRFSGAGGARAVDLTGTPFSGVLELASLGYPVLVWTTEGMAEPLLADASQDGMRWYFPEHCVVVYGSDGPDVLVSDSLAGFVRRDRAAFEQIYQTCGSLAAFVQR